MESGKCGNDQPLAAKFHSLTAWNNEKGAEWVSVGAVQFIDFFLVSNEKAGIEMKLIQNAIAYSDQRGAALKVERFLLHIWHKLDEYLTSELLFICRMEL